MDSHASLFQPGDMQQPVDILMYASTSCVEGPVFAQMQNIRAAAARRNAAQGVHTALLHQSGHFLQWLEGPSEAVRQLIAHVARDARHRGMRLLHASHGARRLHAPWSMALVQSTDAPEAFAQRVASVRSAREAGTSYDPATVWRLLSTPMQQVGAAQQAARHGFQRIMVCSSQADASFRLVRWLAEHHRQEVVHRRFAGTDDLDVATDYVDFDEHGQLRRVIAMARKGIQLGLTRAFLSDYTHVLLLLDGEAENDSPLLMRLLQACRDLPTCPALVGIGADAARHAPLRVLAEQAGIAYADAGQVDCWNSSAAWRTVRPLLDASLIL